MSNRTIRTFLVLAVALLVGLTPFLYAQSSVDTSHSQALGSDNSQTSTVTQSSPTSVNPSVSTIYAGPKPDAIAYDPYNNYVLVADQGANYVSLINSTTNSVVNTISVTGNQSVPLGIAYDLYNEYLYANIYGSDNVSIINVSSGSVVALVNVSNRSNGISFDQYNGNVYAEHYTSFNISVISSFSNSVTGTINLGYVAGGFAYNSSSTMFVTDATSANVSIINTTTNLVTGKIGVGSGPAGIVYDPSSTYLYTANSLSDNVSIINTSTDSVIGSINVGSAPESIAYDPINEYLYVANYGSDNVSIINSVSNSVVGTVSVGSEPSGILYDPSNANVYVTDFNSSNVSVISTSTQSSGMYDVILTEQGLPSGTIWAVNDSQAYSITGQWYYQTNGTSIIIALPDGTYSFEAMANSLALSTSVNFTVSGSIMDVPVVFSTFTMQYYFVSFNESGLPSSSTWQIYINGSLYSSNSSTISVYLGIGMFNYTVPDVGIYVPMVQENTISVTNSNYTVFVEFLRLAIINLNVTPDGANVTLGHYEFDSTGKTYTTYLSQGTYSLVITDSGFQPYSNTFYFQYGQAYYLNLSLKKESVYGLLMGTISPANATIEANGISIPVINGHVNVSLTSGTYYVTASAYGFVTYSTDIVIGDNTITWMNLTMNASSTSHLVYGHISPANASVTFNGISAFVNSSGYYHITLPGGQYDVSFYSIGYFPLSENITIESNVQLNTTLKLEPVPTSTVSSKNLSASGFNVTIANVTLSKDLVNLTYTAGNNGTLTVSLPYSMVSNLTVSQIMGSKVYINGTAYKNFTVTITNNYTVILTVTGLKGDPVITWIYNPAVTLQIPRSNSPFFLNGADTAAIAIAALIIILGILVTVVRRKNKL